MQWNGDLSCLSTLCLFENIGYYLSGLNVERQIWEKLVFWVYDDLTWVVWVLKDKFEIEINVLSLWRYYLSGLNLKNIFDNEINHLITRGYNLNCLSVPIHNWKKLVIWSKENDFIGLSFQDHTWEGD